MLKDFAKYNMKILSLVLARKNSQRLENKHHCTIENKND